MLWRWQRGDVKEELITSTHGRGDVAPHFHQTYSMPLRPRRDLVLTVGAPSIFGDGGTRAYDNLRTFHSQFWPCGLYRGVVIRAGDGGAIVAPLDGGAALISAEGHAFWTEVIARARQAGLGSGHDVLASVGNAPALMTTADAGAFERPALMVFADSPDTSPQPPAVYAQRLDDAWDAGWLLTVAPFTNGTCTGGALDDGKLASFAPFGGANRGRTEICDVWNPVVGVLASGEGCLPDELWLNPGLNSASLTVTYGTQVIAEIADGGVRQWSYNPISGGLTFGDGVIDYGGPELTFSAPAACAP